MLTKDNGENWDCYQFHRMHPQQKRKSHVKLKKVFIFIPKHLGTKSPVCPPLKLSRGAKWLLYSNDVFRTK